MNTESVDLPNFWDKTHPLSSESERMFEQLVPVSGSCQTLQGELLRASSKIGYDWYNNGWGCNNWSGAVIFLQNHIADLQNGIRDQDKHQAFHAALREVHQFSHGEPAIISDKKADKLVTVIHEYVVMRIMANPELVPTELDMWDFAEPDAPYEEDDTDWADSEY